MSRRVAIRRRAFQNDRFTQRPTARWTCSGTSANHLKVPGCSGGSYLVASSIQLSGRGNGPTHRFAQPQRTPLASFKREQNCPSARRPLPIHFALSLFFVFRASHSRECSAIRRRGGSQPGTRRCAITRNPRRNPRRSCVLSVCRYFFVPRRYLCS